MELDKFNKAKDIEKTINRIKFIVKHIGNYHISHEDKINLANNLIDLYKSSYSPVFKTKLSECFDNLLYTAEEDFKEC